jgi:hypothetical protein
MLISSRGVLVIARRIRRPQNAVTNIFAQTTSATSEIMAIKAFIA